MIIKNMTSLGSSVDDIVEKIQSLVLEHKSIEIQDIGIIDVKNIDLVLNVVRAIGNSKRRIKPSKLYLKKLTMEEEYELINYIKKGYKRLEVAEIFNISGATVSRILKRHNVKIREIKNKS